jgi:hypothetical protein
MHPHLLNCFIQGGHTMPAISDGTVASLWNPPLRAHLELEVLYTWRFQSVVGGLIWKGGAFLHPAQQERHWLHLTKMSCLGSVAIAVFGALRMVRAADSNAGVVPILARSSIGVFYNLDTIDGGDDFSSGARGGHCRGGFPGFLGWRRHNGIVLLCALLLWSGRLRCFLTRWLRVRSSRHAG